jgi:hypothetical protein
VRLASAGFLVAREWASHRRRPPQFAEGKAKGLPAAILADT